jgi:hypothetical protein
MWAFVMGNYVCSWQPSWMEVVVTGHNFESILPKDHPCHVCFKLTYWFQRRKLLNIFSIGSYVKIKSIYKICVFGADRKSNMAARAYNVFWLVEILKIFFLETTKPIELWLCRNDHWVEVGVTGHNFESWPPKDHSSYVCFKLTYWFQRRRLLNIFSIAKSVFNDPDLGSKWPPSAHIVLT